jgi:hypothetical protein
VVHAEDVLRNERLFMVMLMIVMSIVMVVCCVNIH